MSKKESNIQWQKSHLDIAQCICSRISPFSESQCQNVMLNCGKFIVATCLRAEIIGCHSVVCVCTCQSVFRYDYKIQAAAANISTRFIDMLRPISVCRRRTRLHLLDWMTTSTNTRLETCVAVYKVRFTTRSRYTYLLEC